MNKDTNFKFKGQGVDEEVLITFGQHPSVLAPIFLKVGAVLTVTLGLLWFESFRSLIFDYPWVSFIYWLWVIVILGYAVHEYYGFHNNLFVLTNERLVLLNQRGMFSRSFSAVPIDSVFDAKHEVHGIFPTMFNFGSIYLYSNLRSEPIKLPFMHQPAKVQDQIMGLIKEVTKEQPLTAEELIEYIKSIR